MSFMNATRRKVLRMGTLTQAAGNPLQWDIPKTGILGGIFLEISATIVGTPVTPDALGTQKIVKKVRLVANSGIDIINISGTGYHSLLRNYCEHYVDATPQAQSRVAISVSTFNLDMWLPVAMNSRDPIGYFMLQNEQTLLQLYVEFEAIANLAASGITALNYTVTPSLEIYTVPVDPKDWPPFNVIHQTIEDQRVVTGAGDVEYYWPRGNTYVQVLHGLGLAQSGSDAWSRAKIRLNQSDFIYDVTPASLSIDTNRFHGYTRLPGAIPFDLMGTAGLGMFGSTRDMLYSAAVTDLASVITATGAGTLFTVRRQLISLEA